MLKLKNISIKFRLYFMAFIFILILIVLNVLVINELYNLAENTKLLYDHPLKVSNASLNVRKGIIKMHRSMKDVTLNRNEYELQQAIETVNQEEDEVHKNLDIIKTNILGQAGKNLADEMETMFDGWAPIRKEVINLTLEKNIESAAEITKEKGARYVDKLERKTDELVNYAYTKADSFMKNTEITKSNIIRNTIITFILLALLTLIVISSLLKGIIRLIFNLKSGMNKIIETGVLKEIDIEGHNEISEMTSSFNKLIVKLKNEFWIKNGIALINSDLTNSKDLREICNFSIQNLCRYIGAGKGAVFLLNSTTNKLILTGSYAFIERDHISNSFSFGEGIIGEVAAEKEAILLRKISDKNEYIQSGLINKEVQNIYALPLKYNDTLLGVIEVATLNNISNEEKTYIDGAVEKISISIYSAIQNKKMKELLEEAEKAEQKAKTAKIETENKNIEIQKVNTLLEEQQQQLQQQSEELQQNNAQLEKQQLLLTQKSNELIIKNNELNKKASQLEKSSSYKSEFLANMSHELRTPLNSIILLSSLIAKQKDSDLKSKNRKNAEIINKAGTELLRLINDILDLSKIEAGKMEIDISNFTTDDIIKNLNDIFLPLSQQNNIDLNFYDNYKGEISSDKNKLLQILKNLLSNSFKFTKEGTISLQIDIIDNNTLRFRVKDSGIGISKEAQDKIFEAFKQVDNSTSRKYGGTGLGLSISSKLASLINGSLFLNKDLKKGSEFILDIKNIIECNINNEGDTVCDTFPNINFEKKVLIVDDDSDFNQMVSNTINNLGIETISAYNAKEALDNLNSDIGIILLDLILPDKNGIEVLREIKKSYEYKDIPIYIISAKEKNKSILELGIKDYLQKPLNKKDIIKIFKPEKNIKNILIAEDNSNLASKIKSTFENLNFNVNISTNIKDCLEKSKNKNITALILDFNISNNEIIELCRQLKDIPIILLTDTELDLKEEAKLKKTIQSIIFKSENFMERLLDEVYFISNNTNSNFKETLKNNFTLKDKKILIVDDDIRNVYVIASALENLEAEIIEAQTGKDALESLEKTDNIDLILMDLMMPEMDGYEAIKKIKANEKIKNIPIIAVTAKAMKNDMDRVLKIGADDYISKPLNLDALTHLVKVWLSKQ